MVVSLEGIEKGKAFPHEHETRIEARDCRFLPFTTVVREKQDVVVVNMDPVMHDIQAYESSQLGARVLFNVPLPMNPQHPRDLKDRSDAAMYHKHLAGEPMKQLVGMSKGRRVFVMQCGFHAYMESWGLALENPYYALTDQNGRFEIGDIPPGTYKMLIWHPYIGGAKEQTITIVPKGQVKVDVTVPAPTGRLYANEMVDKPYTRYGITNEAQSHIVPTLIRQERQEFYQYASRMLNLLWVLRFCYGAGIAYPSACSNNKWYWCTEITKLYYAPNKKILGFEDDEEVYHESPTSRGVKTKEEADLDQGSG
jgi:polysaccharide lyase family 4-like protein